MIGVWERATLSLRLMNNEMSTFRLFILSLFSLSIFVTENAGNRAKKQQQTNLEGLQIPRGLLSLLSWDFGSSSSSGRNTNLASCCCSCWLWILKPNLFSLFFFAVPHMLKQERTDGALPHAGLPSCHAMSHTAVEGG